MKGKSEGEEVDRISNLSDDVLCHILSFLPSMDAIKTSSLSKRWRHLWKTVPSLDFHLNNHTKVHKFLRLRRTKKITRLHLTDNIDSHYEPSSEKSIPFCLSHIRDWFEEAITGEVEHVNLYLMMRSHKRNVVVSLPVTLFTCTTIVTMKIEVRYKNVSFPSCIQLPSLKSLHLNVPKCKRKTCKKFISGSPALEVFYLKQRHVLGFFKELWIERGNLIISIRHIFFELVIKCDCGYDYVQDYLEGHLENIVKAKVSIKLNGYYQGNCFSTSGFSILKSLCNVEFLSLRDLSENESMLRPFSRDDLPQFPNLVQLEFYLTDFHGSLFLQLHEVCPKLDVMKVHNIGAAHTVNKSLVLFYDGVLLMGVVTCFVSIIYVGVKIVRTMK